MKSRLSQTVLALCALVVSLPVFATAQRTFVASIGNDANPCSLALPCRAFGAAVTQTADYGEVVALDSAGYGPVNLTRPVSIVAPPGIYAGITITGGVLLGISVDVATPGSTSIALKGISIRGTGSGTGLYVANGNVDVDRLEISDTQYGVTALGAGRVTLRDVMVRNTMTGLTLVGPSVVHVDGATIVNTVGAAVQVHPSATVFLSHVAAIDSTTGFNFNGGRGIVSECAIVQNGSVPDTYGILANSGANVEISRCTVSGATIAYLSYIGTRMNITDSDAARVSPGGGVGYLVHTDARMTVSDSRATGFAAGFRSDNSGTLRATNCTATGNTIGFHENGGLFESRQNNTVRGNSTDTVGTIAGFGGI